MKKYSITNVDISSLQEELIAYVSKWVAISSDNKIVGSGSTYDEAVKNAGSKDNIILLKVPPVNASLAPQG